MGVTSKNPTEIVSLLRNTFESGRTRPLAYRLEQLRALDRMVSENIDKFTQCLDDDLRKNKGESLLMEIQFLRNDIQYALLHLKDWDKPERPKTGIANFLDDTYILHDPYGVVLVMGSWNYPVLLTLSPVVGAIAAGNCVLIKPSEVSTATNRVIAELVPKYLDADAYHVYEGAIQETTELLKVRFDYIFFTGSTTVGKIVHAAANKFLTPTTLELGGKSPVYIDKTVDMEMAARRIIWGKMMNAGQTCIAPDYLLCPKDLTAKFVEYAKKALKEFYGDNPKDSPNFGRIINENHFRRLVGLLKSGEAAIGGESDISEKYIAPTVLVNVDETDAVMQEEIFGPLLPIINVENAYEAIQFINKRDKPLALYLFSNSKGDVKSFLNNTSAGGVCVNDTIMHVIVHALPFGGVGNSGMGYYHGRYSYETFVHKKGVLHKNLGSLGELVAKARYLPITPAKLNYMKLMLAPRKNFGFGYLSHLLMFVCGVGFMYWFKAYERLQSERI